MIRTFDQHHIRTTEELNGLWNMSIGEREWLTSVPGCWEQILELTTYQGSASYHRSFHIRNDAAAVRLVFKGVSHTADVYVDGEHVGHHYDAYIPFDIVLPHLDRGEHELRVDVDNSFGPDSALHIPNDYYSYGGITRGVSIEALPEAYIKNMRCTPHLNDGGWSATTEVTIANISQENTTVDLQISMAGKEATYRSLEIPGQSEKTITWDENYDEITSWSCNNPQLYQVCAQLFTDDLADDGQLIDDLIDRIGFRTVATQGRQLLLNNEPIFLLGLNGHEEYGSFGSAVPFESIVQDIQYFKDLGANAVRTSHYHNDELFLDLCEEAGILVWEENHARGLNLERMSNPNFDRQCAECNEAMVTNHSNHPSIVIWGLLNECASDTEGGRKKYEAQFSQIRSLDTSRPVTSATCQHFADICLDLGDIVSVNLYNGWYESGSTEDRLNREIEWIDSNDKPFDSATNKTAGSATDLKPIIVSEFGASGLYGFHDQFGAQKWSEERQSQILEDNLHAYLNNKNLTGLFVWQFADNRVSEEEWFLTRPRLHNNKGIVDEFRRPKLAYGTVKRMFHEYSASHCGL
jgi:beta-glucuronidase